MPTPRSRASVTRLPLRVFVFVFFFQFASSTGYAQSLNAQIAEALRRVSTRTYPRVQCPSPPTEDKPIDMAEQMSSPSQEQAMPHLEVLDRVRNIPVVQTALEKTTSTYTYVKDSHHLLNWALNYAEAGLHYATTTAAPLAKKFEGPINTVDQKLCQGLDIVEQKVPIVKQPPKEIYDAAKKVMNSSLQPTVEKLVSAKESATMQATALKDASVKKANEILSTEYGAMAVHGIDNTSGLVNRLLDHYFPPVDGEQDAPDVAVEVEKMGLSLSPAVWRYVNNGLNESRREEGLEPTNTWWLNKCSLYRAPVSAEENKVLHAVQTIGQLSSKTANRVYHSVAAQLRTVKKEDVANYISSVVSILHLTNFLHLGQKEGVAPEAAAADDKPKSE